MRLSKAEAKTVKRRIDVARRFAAEVYHADVDRAMRLYRGDHYDDPARKAPNDRVVVNKIKGVVETQVAAVSLGLAEFNLVPTRQQDEAVAPISLAALTYEWRIGNLQDECTRVKRDERIAGLGFLWQTWLFTTENAQGEEATRTEGTRPSVEGEPADTTPFGERQTGRAGDGETGRPDGIQEVPLSRPVSPSPRLPVAESPVPAERVAEDRPYARRVKPKDVWVAPECDANWENAAYLVVREWRPLDEVKADPALSNTRPLKGTRETLTQALPDDLLKAKDDQFPQDLLRVELYHYYEKKRRLHAVMCQEHDLPLYVSSWEHEYLRYPVAVLRASDDEDRPYPLPPVLEMEHPQREINQARSILALHQRQSNRKLQKVGKLSEHNKRQCRSSTVLGIIEHEDNNLLEAVPHAPIQPEVFQSEQTANEDMRWISALNDYQTGSAPSKRMTEGEVAALQQQGGVRGELERQRYETFVARVARDTLALLQQNSVKTRSLPIFDDQGKVTAFRDYSKREIQGEFMLTVYAGSTSAPSRESDLNQLGLIMQSAPNELEAIALGDQVGVNMRELFRQLLKRMPQIRDVDQIVPARPQSGPAGAQVPPSAGALPPSSQLPPAPPAMGEPSAATLDELLSHLLGGIGQPAQPFDPLGTMPNGNSGDQG